MDSFNKLFSFVAVVLFGLELFTAGANFADNQVANGVVALVLAGLWGGWLLIEWTSRGQTLKHYRKLTDRVDNIFDDLAKVVDTKQSEKKHAERIAEIMRSVIDDVTNGNKVQKFHTAKIEKLFHEKVADHWAKVQVVKPGELEVEIANHPFKAGSVKKKATAPGRSARHDEAAKRGDAARTKLNKKVPAKKVGKK